MSSSEDTNESECWLLGAEILSVRVHGKHPMTSPTHIEEEEEDTRHFEGRSLFIGDIAETVSQEDLWELFQQAGQIDSIDIKKDRMTGANRGFGFVSFKEPSDAKKAIKLFHRTDVKGRAIRIGWAQKNAKVFIAILPDEFTPAALASLMEQFGPIQHSQTRIENNFGYVEYLYRNHAERARSVLDGAHLTFTLYDGQQITLPVRLGWADEQTQKNCVHVQFNAEEAQRANLGKQDLRLKFRQFGDIFSVIIPRYSNDTMKGYAFVHYADTPEGEISTAKAILALDGTALRGVKWSCNFGKQKRERRTRSQAHRRTNRQSPHNDKKIRVEFEATTSFEDGHTSRPTTTTSFGLPLHSSSLLPSFDDFLYSRQVPYYPNGTLQFDNNFHQLRELSLSPRFAPFPPAPSPGFINGVNGLDPLLFPFFSPSPPSFSTSHARYGTHTLLPYIPPRE